jgi:hypothetical protein
MTGPGISFILRAVSLVDISRPARDKAIKPGRPDFSSFEGRGCREKEHEIRNLIPQFRHTHV